MADLSDDEILALRVWAGPADSPHFDKIAFARAAIAADRALNAAPVAEPTVPSAAVLLAEQVLHMDMVTDRGLRARNLARQVLDKAHDIHEGECAAVLRNLASYLGAGGYNATAVDPAVFRDKIMWGIEQINGQQPTPAALSVQAEPDMRHPKIQALIGSNARRNIELSLVEQLIDNPDCDLTAMDMEYWNGMHDRLRDALLKAATPQPPAPVPAPSVGAEGLPTVPDEVMLYIHAYGDSRADDDGLSDLRTGEAILKLRQWAAALASRPAVDAPAGQPRLTVRLTSFPESNGKRNWTALLVRTDKSWDGLIGNCGGITVARGELWNRVAYEAERAKFLIGERDDEPWILDYGDDIETPDNWPGEKGQPLRAARHPAQRENT